VRTPVEVPVPALDRVDVQAGRVYGAEIERRIGTAVARSEMRSRAMAYLAGLLSPADREHSWRLAEISGDQTP
jgi:hypothetical protein